ncbi:MAG: TonB family protein [Ignavibacteriaceae bacterium]
MNNFTLYLLQSSLCLAVFLLFYLLFLKKETFYFWNRIYLLFTGCFSLLIPLFKIFFPVPGYTKEITYMLSTVFVTGQSIRSTFMPDTIQIAEIIYLTVTAAFFIILLIRIFRILTLIKKNESVTLHGQKTVLLEKGDTAFSFFRTIFLPKKQISDLSVKRIIAQERMHIRQHHSVDMVLFEIIKTIQWFNPFAWKLKKEIEAQHEFYVDSGLITDGLNMSEYKNLLLAYSFGEAGNSITNNFNSLLKRRIEMLSRKKSDLFGKIKLSLVLPLIVLVIMMVAMINGSVSFAHPEQQNPQDEKALTKCDQLPSFPGGHEKLIEFMLKNIVYPELAKKAGIQGKVLVAFIVEKDGSITNVRIEKGIGQDCGLDEEAVRIVKLMPKWNPGMDKGEKVRVEMILPIQFALR